MIGLLALSAATVATLLTAAPASAEQKPAQPAPFVELVSPGGDGPSIEARSYATYLRDQRKFYNQAPTGPYGRCVLSDFDERPRYATAAATSTSCRLN